MVYTLWKPLLTITINQYIIPSSHHIISLHHYLVGGIPTPLNHYGNITINHLTSYISLHICFINHYGPLLTTINHVMKTYCWFIPHENHYGNITIFHDSKPPTSNPWVVPGPHPPRLPPSGTCTRNRRRRRRNRRRQSDRDRPRCPGTKRERPDGTDYS